MKLIYVRAVAVLELQASSNRLDVALCGSSRLLESCWRPGRAQGG